MVRQMVEAIRSFFRVNFLAGLFIAVPFGITIGALSWVWTKIHTPLAQFFAITVGNNDNLPWSEFASALQDSNYSKAVIPLISLCILLLCILLLGIITRSIIGRVALLGVEGMVTRLPVVGMFYRSLKQLGEAFLSSDGKSKFKRAVAVQFPYRGCWTLAFVTGESEGLQLPISALADDARPMPAQGTMLTLFVPTAPLPTAGFMIFVPEQETVPLDIPVQDAIKMVVSVGMLSPGETQKSRSPVSASTPQGVVAGLQAGRADAVKP